MSRRTRRIVGAAALFVVLLALLYAARLVGGPPPLGARASLHRAERQYLSSPGDFVGVVDDNIDSRIIAVAEKNGEYYTYALDTFAERYHPGWPSRNMGRKAKLLTEGRPDTGAVYPWGCTTVPSTNFSRYSESVPYSKQHDVRSFFIVKNSDPQAVYAWLHITASSNEEGPMTWSASVTRSEQDFFAFPVTQLEDRRGVKAFYAMTGETPPEGLNTEAEVVFFDSENKVIERMSLPISPGEASP